MTINRTHDQRAGSWVASAQATACDFPIQNLPFGVFRRAGSSEHFRGGVAIGDQVLDVGAAASKGAFSGAALAAATACGRRTLNELLALGPAAWHALREALFDSLHANAGPAARDALASCLVPQREVEMALPTHIGNYTDFYTSIHHARNVGRVVRPDDPLTPNFQWMPIAYHGRASSVVVSGCAAYPGLKRNSARSSCFDGRTILPGLSRPLGSKRSLISSNAPVSFGPKNGAIHSERTSPSPCSPE